MTTRSRARQEGGTGRGGQGEPCPPAVVYHTRFGKYFHKHGACGRWRLRRTTLSDALDLQQVVCRKCFPSGEGSHYAKCARGAVALPESCRRALRATRSIAKYRSGTKYRWQVLLRSARKRGLAVEVPAADAMALMAQPCVYCGSGELQSASPRASDEEDDACVLELESVITRSNGLDRIDNGSGYTRPNIAACCWRCNRMKWVYSVRDFVQACKNVAAPSSACYHDFDSTADQQGCPFSVYSKAAAKKGLDFALSEREFATLTTGTKCNYCLRPASPSYRMGVDRIASHRGYTPANVVPCCSRCNRMKGTDMPETFRDWCRRISDRWGHMVGDRSGGCRVAIDLLLTSGPPNTGKYSGPAHDAPRRKRIRTAKNRSADLLT